MSAVPQTEMLDQHMVALDRARQVRSDRARVKRAVAAGRMTLLGAIEDPCCRSMLLIDLMCCQRHVGRVRASRALRMLEIGERRLVGDLTERQRGLIARLTWGEL